jgi:hypothetical protein
MEKEETAKKWRALLDLVGPEEARKMAQEEIKKTGKNLTPEQYQILIDKASKTAQPYIEQVKAQLGAQRSLGAPSDNYKEAPKKDLYIMPPKQEEKEDKRKPQTALAEHTEEWKNTPVTIDVDRVFKNGKLVDFNVVPESNGEVGLILNESGGRTEGQSIEDHLAQDIEWVKTHDDFFLSRNKINVVYHDRNVPNIHVGGIYAYPIDDRLGGLLKSNYGRIFKVAEIEGDKAYDGTKDLPPAYSRKGYDMELKDLESFVELSPEEYAKIEEEEKQEAERKRLEIVKEHEKKLAAKKKSKAPEPEEEEEEEETEGEEEEDSDEETEKQSARKPGIRYEIDIKERPEDDQKRLEEKYYIDYSKLYGDSYGGATGGNTTEDILETIADVISKWKEYDSIVGREPDAMTEKNLEFTAPEELGIQKRFIIEMWNGEVTPEGKSKQKGLF